MESLPPEDFVPKWEVQEEEPEEISELPVPTEKVGLANKILAVFGFKR